MKGQRYFAHRKGCPVGALDAGLDRQDRLIERDGPRHFRHFAKDRVQTVAHSLVLARNRQRLPQYVGHNPD